MEKKKHKRRFADKKPYFGITFVFDRNNFSEGLKKLGLPHSIVKVPVIKGDSID